MTSLRVTTTLGEVVREPDRAALAATIEAAGRAGAVVLVDGDDRAGDAPFLEASPTADGSWRIEIRRVAVRDADERFWTVVADDDAVTTTLWSWATGTEQWQQLRWHQYVTPPLAAAG